MTKLRIAAAALATLAALPAMAQTAPAARAAPRSYPGVSAEGAAVIARMRAADPVSRQIAGQLRDAGAQAQLAAQRPEIDVAALAATLRRIDGLQAQLRQRQTDQVLATIRALPAADRGPFLRALFAPASPR